MTFVSCFLALILAFLGDRSHALSLSMNAREKIVVTGLGVVSPIGSTVSSFYDSLLNGKSGISKIDRFDASPFKCQIGGQIRDFDPKSYYLKKKKIKQNDLYTHYAVRIHMR